MKTKEELEALKKEVENVSKKIAELTEDELTEVAGGQTPAAANLLTILPIITVGLQDRVPGLIMNVADGYSVGDASAGVKGGSALMEESKLAVNLPDTGALDN